MSQSIESLRLCLLDKEQPIAKRTHASFMLRTMGTEDAAGVIAEALIVRNDSSLLRHELAYILGQMQHVKFCDMLSKLVVEETEDVLVRHEAAEALGAIGQSESLPLLEQYSSHPLSEIAETCQIAVALIQWKHSNGDKGVSNMNNGEFLSVDPAPALNNGETKSSRLDNINHWRNVLIDSNESLFGRYRAMFSLRNENSDEAALALVDGFADTESPLFRHEVAYVLGQMQRSVTVPGLSAVLKNETEHRMVRHEAAEALGAIGGTEVELLLNGYKGDGEEVIRESAVVALDTMDYWAAATFTDTA